MSVTEMFGNLQGFLSADQDVREVWMNNPPQNTITTALAYTDFRLILAANFSYVLQMWLF